jgi:predicted PurR-regulated permease PerM
MQSSFAVVNLLSLIFITPVVAFYLLKDWDRIITKIDHLLPREFAPVVRQQIAEVDSTLAGFIRGQTNVCLFLATFYAIGLSLTGLKFGIIIGIITGFFAILPYVGIAFGLTLGISVAFFQFTDHYSVLYVLFVFMIGQFIEGNFITPRLVGEKVGLHPVWIIFGMLAGATLFGFVGILIAVPITAVIGVFVRFIIKQYLDSKLYHGAHPAGMKALPPAAPASPAPATQGTPK